MFYEEIISMSIHIQPAYYDSLPSDQIQLSGQIISLDTFQEICYAVFSKIIVQFSFN